MPGPPQTKARGPKQQHRKSRSRSRNSSPLSSGTNVTLDPIHVEPLETAYLRTSLAALLVAPDSSIESLIDRYAAGGGNNPPSSTNLTAIHDGIKSEVLAHVASRSQACDRAMRELATKRKERIAMEREREEREREEDERRKREIKKNNPKKRDREEMEDETRPPPVGAHGLARQDGVEEHDGQADGSVSPAKALKKDPGDSPSSSSELGHQPPPAAPVAQYQSFGDDPTKYDDPITYSLGEITPDMTDDEKRRTLCVAEYPHDDLHDLTPGTPPDMDFSNGKSANQVAFTTFMTYIDPFIRQLTEEDVAFLKERGDRVDPFLMPVRGAIPHREVWAREDGVAPKDHTTDHLPQNEARGSIEDMNDDTATTEEVSMGPLLSRFLSIFRAVPGAQKKEEKKEDKDEDANGDISMIGAESTAGDQDTSHFFEDVDTVKPATYMPDLLGSNAPKPTNPQPRSALTLEQRMLQELRYHGILTPEATPDYDAHYDDEVAARLRYLQSELRTVLAENGARKARVLELTEERMALQEYSTIADDLDNQINAAYSKRNRTMGKPKKGASKARPGQALSGVAVSRNTISEGVRMLMERRLQWRDLIGPVVEYGQQSIPKETVFDRLTMERLMKAEGEAGDADDG